MKCLLTIRIGSVTLSCVINAAALLLAALLLAGCLATTNSVNDEAEINTVLYKVKQAFINHDINTFMLCFHSDYLHEGMPLWQVRALWQDRMAEFLLIDFQNVRIEVEDYEAVVSFTMKLQKANTTVYSEEPADHGDLSYFIYDNNKWSVYGNQQSRRP